MKPMTSILIALAFMFLSACSQANPNLSKKVVQTVTFTKLNDGSMEYFQDAQNGVSCYIFTSIYSYKADRISCTLSATKISGGMSKVFPLQSNAGVVQRVEHQETHDVCYLYQNNNSYAGTGMSCLSLSSK